MPCDFVPSEFMLITGFQWTETIRRTSSCWLFGTLLQCHRPKQAAVLKLISNGRRLWQLTLTSSQLCGLFDICATSSALFKVCSERVGISHSPPERHKARTGHTGLKA